MEVGSHLAFNFLILITSLILLGKSAEYLVIAISRIGRQLGLSEFITGFILLGIATSAPEISVGINAALSGNPQLSLGNLFGANIVLMTLVCGGVGLFNHGIKIRDELSQPTRTLQIVFLILSPLLLLLDSYFDKKDAIILIFLYTMYLVYLYTLRPKDSPPIRQRLFNHQFLHSVFLTFTGVVGVILFSKAIVSSSLSISDSLAIPSLTVGVLILSVGTNLPEIALAIAAIKKHHTNLLIGDILGSMATNTFIVAMLGLIAPFQVKDFFIFETTSIYMIISLCLFLLFTRSKNFLSPNEALILTSLYLSFLISETLPLFLKL